MRHAIAEALDFHHHGWALCNITYVLVIALMQAIADPMASLSALTVHYAHAGQ